MTWQPEEFDDLAEELRRRVEAEFRSEAEEVERLVQLQRRRHAVLRDIAITAMHQGQRVTVSTAGDEWTGELVAVGADYLSLKTPALLVDTRLDAVAMRLVPAREGGHMGKPESATFKARLSEFEMTGEELTVRCRIPVIEVTGVIAVVALDHVEIRSLDERCYLPLDGVFMVIRPLPE